MFLFQSRTIPFPALQRGLLPPLVTRLLPRLLRPSHPARLRLKTSLLGSVADDDSVLLLTLIDGLP